MINVGMYYNVKKGHEKEFEDTFQKVVDYLKNNVKGFEKASIYKKVGEEGSTTEYMIYSEWKDADSFREFTTAKAFRETTEYGKSIIEGRPYHRIFNEVKEGN
ncbi:antibiotic biosynthesis monooxygenase [Candidatus Parvarchaeota archaeon]|nr:antibiotic biosynthesis monooxygenase [Candidatus Parvarchaeota archaeon]